MKPVFQCCFLLIWVNVALLPAQSIQRAEGTKLFPKGNEQVRMTMEPDIFGSYAGLEPPIEGQWLNFQEGIAVAEFKGGAITVTKDANGKFFCKLPDGQEAKGDSITGTFRYYGRNRPLVRKMSTEPRFQHSSRKYYSSFVPNQSSSGYNQVVVSPNVAVSGEWRYSPMDEMKPYTFSSNPPEYSPIPATYYKFEFPGQQRFTVFYQNGKYYLQNPSFLQGTTAKGAKLLLVDYNANGNYTDGVDMVMFTDSPVQTGAPSKDDVWNSIVGLRLSNVMRLAETDGLIGLECPNAKFAGSKDKGEVKIDGLPKGAKLFVNGEELATPKGGKGIVAAYGHHEYRIEAPGQMDMFGEFVVDAQHPAVTVVYKAPGLGVKMELKTFGETPFFMTVIDPEGKLREYDSPDSVKLMPGTNVVTILQEGETMTRKYEAKLGSPINVSISKEMFIERARKKQGK